MSEYFGSSTASHAGYEFNFAAYTNGDKANHVRTCPGSGSMTVNSLGLFGRSNDAGISYYTRIGVYTTNLGTLVGDSVAITVATANAWYSGVPDGAFSLTGGANYMFCNSIKVGGNNLYWGYQDCDAGDVGYQAGDYVDAGMPASITLGSNNNRQPEIRVEVTAAAVATKVKQASSSISRRRNINTRNSGLNIL